MIYVLYHADCRDGFGSAYAAWKSLGDEATYIPCHHGRPLPEMDLSPTTKIYVVDFSFKREVLTAWHDAVDSVFVIDHHVTARQELEGLSFAHFDMKRSAAILTWQHFHGADSTPPRFLLHIEDMDLWKFELEGTREVNVAIDSYEQRFDIWDGFVSDEACAQLQHDGRAIRRYVDRQVEYICKERYYIAIDDYEQVPAVNTGIFVSEVCAHLLATHPDAKLASAWMQIEQDRRVYSLRSRQGETDVSTLAKRFGGGGHPSASGFSTKTHDSTVTVETAHR